jgi:hypothetical protein
MDAFCAFHPNREIFAVLPLRLKVPEIPNDAFCDAWALKEFSSVRSETPSINPSPNVFIGMRKITLLSAS